VHPDKLLADLKQQVKLLELDLLERAEEPEFHEPLMAEYAQARSAKRIAMPYESWLDGQVTQAAVAWVLGTVFLRFSEDNGLIEYPYLAAPSEHRREIPVDRQHEFYGRNPGRDTDRDWIVEGFADMSAASMVAAGLFDMTHNPMWRISPSHHAAQELVKFWRLRGEDGTLNHDFTDPEWNTRFLGDLYQNLSEAARKKFALLQTPEFVEEFILDLTLTPAIDEFGLEPVKKAKYVSEDTPNVLRFIDPTCGSGHFLLGAFDRLLTAWLDSAPGIEPWELIHKVLAGIHGTDKNPFAVAIARFRLFLATMKAAGASTLKEAPEFPLNIAVGDSLLHGRGAPQAQETLISALQPHTFASEDIHEQRFRDVDLLGRGSYHVVVGNPPYITVNDKQENKNYRKAYSDVCKGQYALSAPFAARFFELSINGGHQRTGAGYVGQITANSFMKREFGRDLIEKFFNLRVDLTHVIDSSGAYIPGHSTPTVILIGRHSIPRNTDIRVVQGIQGEPTQPIIPSEGLVWKAIRNQVHLPKSETRWVSSEDLKREHLAKYPWSLSGGGASALRIRIESAASNVLKSAVSSIGSMAVTREDNVYVMPRAAAIRLGINEQFVAPLCDGDCLRDWQFRQHQDILFPYNPDGSHRQPESYDLTHYWKYRQHLAMRKALGGTQEDRGLPWYEYSDFHPYRWNASLKLVFPGIGTHLHFMLNRTGKIFNRWAPIIQLPEESGKENYLELLGLLNSSTACFWLKEVSQSKGNGGIGGGISDEPWEHRYEFTGTKLQELPLPPRLPLDVGQRMDSLSQELSSTEPSVIFAHEYLMSTNLDVARATNESIRNQMIAIQEELDWEVYGLYGLLDETEWDPLTAEPGTIPEVKLGQRAFEIILARNMASGDVTTEWFSRHGSVPTTEIPNYWPSAYRELVQRRIEIIESRKEIALIERPEYKRRWAVKPWEVREQAALRAWLLDVSERRELWLTPDLAGAEQPQLLTVNQLADKLRSDENVVSVAQLFAGSEADLAKVLADMIDTEHVPYLGALRYRDSGLRKRKQWEATWDLQREEDRTGLGLNIPVPPKYESGDFRKTSYWRHRGKLDVPKEPFISYQGASPDTDSSLLLGWAGWNHRQVAHALTALILNRSEEGWGPDRLAPLLAGLAEQLPWVRQWHGDVDPELGVSPAEMYSDFLADQQERFELSDADLANWRPPATTRRKKQK
jgi:hypothetical protein